MMEDELNSVHLRMMMMMILRYFLSVYCIGTSLLIFPDHKVLCKYGIGFMLIVDSNFLNLLLHEVYVHFHIINVIIAFCDFFSCPNLCARHSS